MTYVVTVQSLEQANGNLEILGYFLLLSVPIVAAWLESADASSVLVPLVLPEALVVSLIVFPESAHVRQEVGFAVALENGGDVGVFTRWVAVGIVRPVAVIWPQSVKSPRVVGSCVVLVSLMDSCGIVA